MVGYAGVDKGLSLAIWVHVSVGLLVCYYGTVCVWGYAAVEVVRLSPVEMMLGAGILLLSLGGASGDIAGGLGADMSLARRGFFEWIL